MARISWVKCWGKCLVAFLLTILPGFVQARGETEPSSPKQSEDTARIERIEQHLLTLINENQRLAADLRALKQQVDSQAKTPNDTRQATQAIGQSALTVSPSTGQVDTLAEGARSVPLDILPQLSPDIKNPDLGEELPVKPELSVPVPDSPDSRQGRFWIDYQNGFTIIPFDEEETPFSLRVRNQNVFRYTGFSRSADFWTNSAGTRIPITNSNYFGIPRGRLIFSGMALMPQISYLLNIDYNSVTSNPIGFRAYVLSFRFSDAIELSIGQSKVPGSREWLESAFAPLQGPDRTMATTFFRPSLSQGVWITGEPREGWYYHAMMSNGFNTLNLVPEKLNDRFCWSGSTWWEPWGDFGAGYSDIQDHDEPAIRLGTSYTFALGKGNQAESDAVENSPVRLSDGTLITTPGAIAPGVTLQSYDISLAAIDLSYKYRGLGISSEVYFQDLLKLNGTGPLPIQSTGAFGGFVQGGYFILPQRAELYVRSSYVTGDYGSGNELACGFNWFIRKGRENLRFTLDSTWLDRSPAGQNRTGFVAGESGFLLRTQITAAY